jgi:Tfp pilus assembly protein PilN
MNVDFLPERVLTGRAMRARVFRQGYLLGIMLAALIGLAYFNEERIGRAEAQMSGLDNRSANMTTQVNTMYTLQGQLSDLMIKQRIDNRLGSRINGMDILGELGRILPVSMTLTSLELDARMVAVKLKPAAGGVATSAGSRRSKAKTKTINRLKLTITGLSPNNVDVANFIADMSASPLFEEVDMGYAKNVVFREKPAKEFQTSCYVAR